MGTSGSYSGSGGKLGNDLRDNIDDWLDSLPPGQTDGEPPDQGDQGEGDSRRPADPPSTRLEPAALLPVVGLLRPRSRSGGGADGPGGGGGARSGGGPQRSAAQAAS